MPVMMCPAGHFYDLEQSSSCPICEEDRKAGLSERHTTEDPETPKKTDYEPFKTTVETVNDDIPPGPGLAPQPTKPWPANTGGDPLKPIATTLMTSYDNKDIDGSVMPVVGWLVIVNGPGAGRDFRLVAGRNRLGRDNDQEVCLNFGPQSDNTISRQANAVIYYVPDESQFLMPFSSDWKTLPKVNGQIVTATVYLKPGDLIELGQTKFMFVPLCGPAFKW